MTQTDTTIELTRDELISEVDRVARRIYRMSAAEFARALRRGSLAAPARAAEAIALLNLLRDDDPIFDGE